MSAQISDFECNFEGPQGVRNFIIAVRKLGYVDDRNTLQFPGGCYGDLIDFLEDNPGAVEAMAEWIIDHQHFFDIKSDDENESDEDEGECDDCSG